MAVRSERHGAPALIRPVFRPTARSAMVVSSVSPERWLTIAVQPVCCAILMAAIVSVKAIYGDSTAHRVEYDDGFVETVPTSHLKHLQVVEWVRGGGVITEASAPPPPEPTRDEIILRALIDNAVVTQDQINTAERNIRDDRGLPTIPDVGGGGGP